MKYQPVIGLEIHVELKTNSKMFCACKNDPDEKTPNKNICPICTGQPGTLPVINKEAVRKVIKTGLALNCEISELSKFDRKNYFYPDLPKGYQISQYDLPLCRNGFLEIGCDDKKKKIRIRRIHLEEDTGKLLHIHNTQKAIDYSLVDFNRAGVPLMELVTEPDFSTGEEAREFAERFQQILRYLDVSNADMERGQMRVEVNISLSKNKKLGTKVEIKNLNSFRAVERAINYEIERQSELIEKGEEIVQETRGWNEMKGVTVSQREKEESHDYRYFPDPDLPTIQISKDFIEEIKSEIPELPHQRKERFIKEYKLDEKTVDIFVSAKDLGEYFEKVVSELKRWLRDVEEKTKKKISQEEIDKLIKLASNYIITDLQGLLKGKSVNSKEFLITPENFAEFITLIFENKITSKSAKSILEEMFKTGADPSHILEKEGLSQITDRSEIEKLVKEVILENQQAVQDYKNGKESALQFLIGKAMAKTRGRANPKTLAEVFRDALK